MHYNDNHSLVNWQNKISYHKLHQHNNGVFRIKKSEHDLWQELFWLGKICVYICYQQLCKKNKTPVKQTKARTGIQFTGYGANYMQLRPTFLQFLFSHVLTESNCAIVSTVSKNLTFGEPSFFLCNAILIINQFSLFLNEIHCQQKLDTSLFRIGI